MKLTDAEIRVLALYVNHKCVLTKGITLSKKIDTVERKSDKEFDLRITGKEYSNGSFTAFFSAWLPLGAIGWLVKWDRPEIVSILDFSIEAGWSAVRDSSEDKIWLIFERFVLGENRLS